MSEICFKIFEIKKQKKEWMREIILKRQNDH